jgi:elongation factor P
MAEVVSTNQFRNGMHIELDGQTWRIVDFQHVKPGKGGAFVRTKLKSLQAGAVVDKTFRAGEKFARVRTEQKNMQYLYDSGDEVVFMDESTYEQLSLPHALLEDELPKNVEIGHNRNVYPGGCRLWETLADGKTPKWKFI